MAKLSEKDRKKLPKSVFGLVKKRKYPMPDAIHAQNAKSRATQMEKKGVLSESEEKRIKSKANKILKKKK